MRLSEFFLQQKVSTITWRVSLLFCLRSFMAMFFMALFYMALFSMALLSTVVLSSKIANAADADGPQIDSPQVNNPQINNPQIDSRQVKIKQREYWSVQLENDLYANTGDRYYTNGTQFSRTITGDPPQWLQKSAKLFPAFKSDGVISGVNYTFGQKMFTGDNTLATEPVPGDRPYAGYLYFSTSLLSSVSRKNTTDTGNLLEFTIGLVGPSAYAEETQSAVHDLIGSDPVNGWDYQLSDEPTLGVSYSRFWREIQPLSGSLETSLSPHVNVTLGNVYTYLASGIMLRVGTKLENDLAPPNIRPGFPGLSLFRPDKQYNWYFFAGFEARAVARNIFLDGNTFRDSYSVDKKPLVGDFQFGFVLQTGNVRYALSNVIRTEEFEGQNESMRFGAINISFLYK